jgi:hypothetical protein
VSSNIVSKSILILEENGFCEKRNKTFVKRVNNDMKAIFAFDEEHEEFFRFRTVSLNKNSKQDMYICIGFDKELVSLYYIDEIIEVGKFFQKYDRYFDPSFEIYNLLTSKKEIIFREKYKNSCLYLRFFENNGKRCLLTQHCYAFDGIVVSAKEKTLFQI